MATACFAVAWSDAQAAPLASVRMVSAAIATTATVPLLFIGISLVSCTRLSDNPARNGGARATRLSLALGPDDSLYQRLHVEDKPHLAVAQDGRAADAGKPLEQPAERLDHCLGLAHERIDHEADPLTGTIHHHDVFAPFGLSPHPHNLPAAPPPHSS